MKTYTPQIFLQSRLKILALGLLILITNFKANSQIKGTDLFEIMDLYIGEQYDVVKSKLSNLGFEIRESTPDYSNNKIDYRGNFMMMQPYECVDYSFPNKKTITNSYIKFETQSDASKKYVKIEFEVRMPNAKYVYQNKFDQLVKEIGPADYSKIETNGMSSEFKDKKNYYGKNVEDPSSLSIFNPHSYITLKFYTLNSFCATEYTNLEGNFLYNLAKYPVENPDDYFTNIDLNKKLISVPVKRQGNTYSVEISIGGKNLVYIIDSGASEMFISNSTEKFLLDLGIIRNSDYLPSKTFVLADGSEKIYRRVKIPTIRIGTIKVEDVEAAITEDNSPLLLGKSFLDKFKSWKVNNANLTIELQY
jgi:clan AA aspartic protease (TIGR02281 family)